MPHHRKRLCAAIVKQTKILVLNQRTEEEEGALGLVRAISVVLLAARSTVKLDLPSESTGPDDNRDNRDEGQTEESARAPSEVGTIEDEETDHQGANDGTDTFESSIQRTYRNDVGQGQRPRETKGNAHELDRQSKTH
jgi:hypothetical protein